MNTRLAMAALLLALPSVARAQSANGDWLTDNGSAVVHVESCGAHLCGTIARVLDRAAPVNDINNPDPRVRAHSLVGTRVLSDFSRSRSGWDDGMAYDPKAGRSYHSRLALDGPNRLKVTGCILFLCRNRFWTRAH